MTKRTLLKSIRFGAWCCLIVTATFGFAGLMGWIFGVVDFLRLSDSHSPIQPTPALMLLTLAGAALTYGRLKRNVFSGASSFLVLAIAVSELLGFLGLTGFNFVASDLFRSLIDHGLQPMRTPANTAIALAAAAFGITSLNLPHLNLNVRQFLAAIGGTICAAMGAITVVAYLSGDAIVYRWNGSADVALFAAAGCFFCGSGLLMMLWLERDTADLPKWMPVPISLGFFIEFLILWISLNQHATEGFKPPSLALGLGFMASLLIGIAVHLARSNFDRRRDLEQINNSLEMEMSQRRAAEEKLLEQQSQTAYLSRLKALGEMAGGIAHEINNPLMIISGRVFQLKHNASKNHLDRKEVISTCEKIGVTVERIAKIVENLRIFSGDGSAPASDKPAKIRNVIDTVLSLCQEKLNSKGIEIRITGIDSVKEEIAGDPVKISQVILNLVSNSLTAVSALPDKWIHIAANIDEAPQKTPDESSAKKIALRITDSGQGIPANLAQKIFQPFFTTNEIGSGTGLGLSVARGIIESAGGTIRLDTASPHTSFVITLPLARGNVNPHEKQPHVA